MKLPMDTGHGTVRIEAQDVTSLELGPMEFISYGKSGSKYVVFLTFGDPDGWSEYEFVSFHDTERRARIHARTAYNSANSDGEVV